LEIATRHTPRQDFGGRVFFSDLQLPAQIRVADRQRLLRFVNMGGATGCDEIGVIFV